MGILIATTREKRDKVVSLRIQTSVFGAEFVDMKIVMETLQGISYKLRMMEVPISGPSYIVGDNMSVIHNNQCPGFTLERKSNSI